MKAELLKKESNKVTLKITVENDKFEAAITKLIIRIKENTIYLDSEKVKLQSKL